MRQHSSKPIDLRSDVPRSGKEMLAGFAWLGRMTDKARAKRAGTVGDYMSLCPIDKGFLQRTGVGEDEFVELILAGEPDEEISVYFERHVAPRMRDAANRWVLVDMGQQVADLDREERRAA